MDIEKLFIDFSVPIAPEGSKHHRPGWVNVECPFCTGNPGHHLGFNTHSEYFYCWRCGYKPKKKAIAGVLGVSYQQAGTLLRKYGGRIGTAREVKPKITRFKHRLPSGCTKLQTPHKKYLERRKFDPEWLETEYQLLGTPPVSKLDGVNYKNRIVAPIFWGREQVSFQARDISNRHPMKYLACPKKREKIDHKHVLYGTDQTWKSKIGIAVEGITDVWRLGSPAFATFGIEFSFRQLRWMAKLFEKVIVIYDDEPQAIAKANQLVSELHFRGISAVRMDIQGDPGGLSNYDAKYLINTILKTFF